jgi:uroporphyrinogen-III decarboxylase
MPDNSALFQERQKRYFDTIALNKTDRVPIVPMVESFPIRQYGHTMKEAFNDLDLLQELWMRYHQDFQPDMGDNPFFVNGIFTVMEALDFKSLKWAGHGVDDNTSYQFAETEVMPPEHYDWFLSDPSDYMFRHYFPTAYGKLAPLAKLPSIRASYYFFTPFIWAALAGPEMASLGQALSKAASESLRCISAIGSYGAALAQAGWPQYLGAMTQAPLDVVGDYLRGIKGMLMDLRRRPEKLLAACDLLLPPLLDLAVNSCKLSGIPVCFIPLHKCMDNFMSQAQFEKFYWPTLLELMRNLVSNGIAPYLLIEGVCDQRLPVMIRDAPPGKCVYHLENSDIFAAKKLARDKVCLRGNVPVSILITGTPDDVRAYCKRLIDEVAPGGGFIMDTGVTLTDAKAENVKAMFEYTREHGLY